MFNFIVIGDDESCLKSGQGIVYKSRFPEYTTQETLSKLPNDKEKGKVYEELFQKNTGQADLEQVNKLLKYFESTEKTNMNIFVEKCLESLQTFK